MKYHMDIRDKPCPICELSFHELKTLKNHMYKIHNVGKSKTTTTAVVLMELFDQWRFSDENDRRYSLV